VAELINETASFNWSFRCKSLHESLQKSARVRLPKIIRDTCDGGAITEAGLKVARSKLTNSRAVHFTGFGNKDGEFAVVDSLIKNKAFRHKFAELDTSSRKWDFIVRVVTESRVYGGTWRMANDYVNLSVSERGVYCILDYHHLPDKFPTEYYGPVGFVFKEKMLERCSFTPRDSSMADAHETYTWDCIEGILCLKPDESESSLWADHVITGADVDTYIEAHLLGRVSLRDVEEIRYPGNTGSFERKEYKDRLNQLQQISGARLVSYI
jgi:hypothetical protein